MAPPGDSYERQAEQVAEQVAASGAVEPGLAPPLGGSSDEALPDVVRRRVAPILGQQLDDVRVHHDAAADAGARALGARAFTHGADIWLRAGEQPTDLRLMAHELTHTVQQRRSSQLNGAPVPIVQLDREDDEERLRRLGRTAGRMERRAELTTEQAQSVQAAVEAGLSPDESDQAVRQRARSLQRYMHAAHTQHRERRRDGRLVGDLQIVPQIIRIDRGEASRISFRVRAPQVAAIDAYILERRTEGGAYRFFNFSQTLKPGHKVAIWEGLWDGQRNRPPQTGTYPLLVTVRTPDGQEDQLRDNIRVENPTHETVLPRSRSGLGVRDLSFDGHHLQLRDSEGNVLRMRATSGLRAGNPQSGGRDWCGPEHQFDADRGPLPEGTYTIRGGDMQQAGGAGSVPRFPTGARATVWGRFRVLLHPLDPALVGGRDEFFIHLDVSGDGTAGCIGVDPADEGQYNLLFSTLFGLDAATEVPVHVDY